MICTQCGTQNPEGGVFCVGCGSSLQQAPAQAPPQAPPQAAPFPQYGAPQYGAPQYGAPQYGAPQAAVPPVGDEAQDAAANKTMGILAYIIFFIPLITGDAQKSPFVKFHANQGLVIWLTAIAGGIAVGILTAILGMLRLWFLGPILSAALSIGIIALVVMGIMGASKGEKKELPLVGKFKILK